MIHFFFKFNNSWIIYYCGTNPDRPDINNVNHVTYYRLSKDLRDWSEPNIAFDAGQDGNNFGFFFHFFFHLIKLN